MNLPFKLKRYLYLPAVLLIFFACDKPDELGLGFENGQVGVYATDTFTLTSSVVLMDSLATKGLDYLAVGACTDPNLGTVGAEGYTQLRLTDENFDFGSNPVVDSIKLFLDYTAYFGDTTTTQTLEVYELDEVIDENVTYYNSSTLLYSNLLGSLTFNGMPDSVGKIEITLSNTFNNGDLITLAGTDQETFNTNMNGIVITPVNNTDGAIYLVNLLSSETKVALYYHNDSDTLTYTFEMDGKNTQRFHSITGNRASNAFLNTLVTTGDEAVNSAANDVCYLQSGVGLRTKVNFPYVDKLSALGNVVINKAELVIPAIAGTTPDNFVPPTWLAFYRVDTLGNIILDGSDTTYLQVEFSNPEGLNNNLSVSYDSDKEEYIVPLTNTIQQLVLGNKFIGGIMITTPPRNVDFNIFGTALQISDQSSLEGTVERLVFGSNYHTTSPMKLRVYYTPTN